mmetsp:Transcript_14972/g.40152  ORF Transcript_14972/g.40152 Transcript_14972/m.40152 type:complete len:510 (+) Transcript_14972:832-2361(+)
MAWGLLAKLFLLAATAASLVIGSAAREAGGDVDSGGVEIAAALKWYRERWDEDLEKDLFELLAIRSISGSPDCMADIERVVNWATAKFKAIGMTNVNILRTPADQHPLAYAEWRSSDADALTVLLYGHLDVQPVDPESSWDSAPFEARIHEGKYFARGVSDDKGPVFGMLVALQSLIATLGNAPINVKILLEAHEEIGSPGMREFVREHRELLRCDYAISADGVPSPSDEAAGLVTGMKGAVAAFIDVKSSQVDAHAGIYGGLIMNPALALSTILASLHAHDGSIAIPGFYDDVRALDEAERKEYANYPVPLENDLAALGAVAAFGEKYFTPRERQFARPTLDVVGMSSGYTGVGFKAVLPPSAHAKVGIRIVPNQDPDKVLDQLERHVHQVAPCCVNVSVTRLPMKGEAVTFNSDGALFQAVRRVLAEAFRGNLPVEFKVGGTIPIAAIIPTELNADVQLLSLTSPTDAIHAPNENFALDSMHRTIEAFIKLPFYLRQEHNRYSHDEL